MLDPQRQHAQEDVLKQYIAGGLPEELAAPLEEHLLICDSCRERLDELEFAYCTREAARSIALEGEPERTPGLAARIWAALTAVPKPAWAAAAAAAAVMVVVSPRWTSHLEYETVALRAVRADDVSSSIASGKAVQFEIDLTEIPPAPIFLVEVADSRGRTLWKESVQPQANALSVRVTEKLSAGQYWVRLYSDGQDPHLLREFGLLARGR